jgi:biopolymer transport protein TolR
VNKDGEVFINSEKVEDGKLGDALGTLKAVGEERVFVRADQDVPYGAVMHVIGEVKAAGINDVGMITEMERNKR